jgi:hypothetical protein
MAVPQSSLDAKIERAGLELLKLSGDAARRRASKQGSARLGRLDAVQRALPGRQLHKLVLGGSSISREGEFQDIKLVR